MGGHGRIVPDELIRAAVGGLAELHPVGKEFHLADAAVAVRRVGGNQHAGGREKILAVRRRGEGDAGGDVVDDHRRAHELQEEADVRAVRGLLVDFHRHLIQTLDQIGHAQDAGGHGLLDGLAGRQGVVEHGSGEIAAAEHFPTVQIHHARVIVGEQDAQVGERVNVVHGEGAAEIGRDVKRARRPARHKGRLICVAVTQFGRAAGPQTVVEVDGLPGRALIGAIGQVIPNRVGVNQHGAHPKVDRRRHVVVTGVVLTRCAQTVRAADHVAPSEAKRCRRVLPKRLAIDKKVHVGDETHRQDCEDGRRDGIGALEDGVLIRGSNRESIVRDEHPDHARGHDLAQAVRGHGIQGVAAGRRIADDKCVGRGGHGANEGGAVIQTHLRDRAGGGGGRHGHVNVRAH